MENKQRPFINASEIGTYSFCPRAWGLEKRGYRSGNRKAMDDGTEFHRQIGRRETLIRDLKILAAIAVMILILLILRELIG